MQIKPKIKARQGLKTPALLNYLLTPRTKLNGKLLFCRTNTEHLRATAGAYTLSCWFTILHGYAFSILHLLFGSAFHTVSLHEFTSLLITVLGTINHLSTYHTAG